MDRAEDYWSDDEHFEQMIEECAELILAIQHHRRSRVTHYEVIEEMVDVEIMLDRFKVWYLKTYGLRWDDMKMAKLLKMEQLMDKGGK